MPRYRILLRAASNGIILALAFLAKPAGAEQTLSAPGGVAAGSISGGNFNIGLTPEMLADLKRLWEELSEYQKKEIAKLQGDLDLNQQRVKSALEILGEADVPPERLAAKLLEIAGKFKELKTAAAAQPGDDSKITALKAAAQKAIQDGQLGRADEILAAIEKSKPRRWAHSEPAIVWIGCQHRGHDRTPRNGQGPPHFACSIVLSRP